jgi:flagellar motility protein MotE (MotC chaperone)
MLFKKKQAVAARARRPARGTLTLVALLLVASAVVRLGDDAGRAYAVTEAALSGKSNKADEEMPKAPEIASKESCEPDPDIAAMLTAFKAREDRLAEREARLADRIQALAVADQQIENRLAALTEAEDQLRATLALADTAAEDDLARLTAVYESMKPKEAATLFEQMDPQFAAGFLGRMQPAAAAGVMAGLQPETAYAVSVILAGRNANVPKN